MSTVDESLEVEKEYPYGGVGVAGGSLGEELRSLPGLHRVIVTIMLVNICVALVLACATVPFILIRWGYGYVLEPADGS